MATIQKSYQYKIYDSSFVYIGTLDPKKVVNDFGYNQTINSAGTQIEIKYASNEPDKYTVNANNILIYEFSQYYPNGLLVFSGYISKWKATFGADNIMTMTCISNGQDLSQYIIEAGDTTYMSQLTDTGTSWPFGGDMSGTYLVMQTFTVAANKVIGSVDLEIDIPASGSVTVAIRQQLGASPAPGTGGDTTVMSTSVSYTGAFAKSVQHFAFNSPATLTTGNTYYISVGASVGGSGFGNVYGSNTNPYAGGTVWQVNGINYFNPSTQVAGSDLYFNIYQKGGSVVATYTTRDTSFMLSDLMASYNQRGGLMIVPPNPITPLHQIAYNDNNIPGAYWGAAYAQPYTPTATETINIVQLDLGSSSGSEYVSVQLCKGNPATDQLNVISGTESYTFGSGNSQLAVSNSRIISSTTPGIVGFTFATPQVLTAGQAYYFLIEFPQAGFGNLLFKGGSSGETSPAPFGALYYALATINNASFGMATNASNPNMYINLAYQVPVPSIIDAGYLNTGTVTSYTFKVQTMLAAVQVIESLSPADWYWYGDPANNSLVWKQASATAELVITKGRHIGSMEIEATKENVKNVVYFTGGDDGSGTSKNVFVKKTAAIGANRVGLDLLSDNRVSGTGGATVGALVAQSDLNQKANESYITTITLLDSVVDTNQYKIGKILGFSGFGDFADALLLQIVGVNKQPDYVTLNVGTLPVRQSQAVADIEADLTSAQTLNNPSTPS